jgi:hyaluronate lyase
MAAPLSRRSLLLAGAGGLSLALLPRAAGQALPALATPTAAAEPFAALVRRWRDRITGQAASTPATASDPEVRAAIDRLDTVAADFRSQIVQGDDRDRLWPDLPLFPLSNNNHGLTYERIFELARAWATPGRLHQDPDLLADIRDGLDLLHRVAYNPGITPSGNWWWWEIGNPRALLDTCVLIADELPRAEKDAYTAAVGHFSPDPNYRGRTTGSPETGANRVDKAMITFLRGILQEDADVVMLGRDALSDTVNDGRHSVFRYVTSGDGFYTDGSFIQHGDLPYVGTYGVVALAGIGDLLYLGHESPWAFTDPAVTNLFDNVDAAFVPFIRDGHMFDTVRGRAVSRQREPDAYWGQRTMGALLLLAGLVGPEYGPRFRGLTKGWLRRDPPAPFEPSIDLDTLHRAAALLADDGTEAIGQPVGHRVFHNQDRMVHHRPRWSFTVSLSSERIARYEAGNEENARGWYLGDGMTYLYLDDDPEHYAADYWPTVDSYRHAGITRRVREREEMWEGWTGTPAGRNAWVGGCSVGARFGATGMDFADEDGVLTARKSWFSLDDEVVALGAAIATVDDLPVETVIDNRAYAPGRARRVLTPHGLVRGSGEQRLDAPSWVHLEGVGGYVFPRGGRVRVLDEQRQGAWSDINTGADNAGNDDVKTRRYTTLWIDHDLSGGAGDYAYVIVPGASPGRTRRRAAELDVSIVANNAEVQAIAQRSTGLVLANFFSASHTPLVTADAPCSVGVAEIGDEVVVAIADPSRRAGEPVRVTFPALSGLRPVETPDSIAVASTGPLVLECATQDTRGAVQQARFTRSPAQRTP